MSKSEYILSDFSKRVNLPKIFIDRFWKKISKNGPIPKHMPHLGKCWVWTAGLNATGYGCQSVGLSNGKVRRMLSHRASWIINKGPIPDGLHVLHKCDNRACVRPFHLWVGTERENKYDSVKKVRHNLGEKHGLHKLSEKDVIEIRRLYECTSGIKLSKKFGVCRGQIYKIVKRENWRHI